MGGFFGFNYVTFLIPKYCIGSCVVEGSFHVLYGTTF